MSMQFKEYKPGDLIRAESFNQLWAMLQSLDVRLTKVENSGVGGSKLSILSLLPAVAHAGEPLEIRGQNFGVPATANIVTVDGFPIDRFVSGSSTSLVFGIPFINISGTQKVVQVIVSSQSGSDSAQLTLLPALNTPIGVVAFTQDPANATIGAIQPGGTATFGFVVESQTNVTESYQLAVVLSNATGPATLEQWRAGATIFDASDVRVPASPIVFQPFVPQTYRVRLTVPATATAGTSGVSLALSMRSVHNDPGLSRTSDPVVITVGQAPPFNNPGVQWVLDVPAGPVATGANPARLVLDASNQQFVELPYAGNTAGISNTGLVRVKALFKMDGNFAYTATLVPAGAAATWKIGSGGVPQPPNSLGKQKDENALVGVVLTLVAPQAGAGHPEQATLIIKATRTPTPSSTDLSVFDSWITVALRGYAP